METVILSSYLLVSAVILGAVAVARSSMKKQRIQRDQEWARTARTMGLSCSLEERTISGELDGFPFAIAWDARGSGTRFALNAGAILHAWRETNFVIRDQRENASEAGTRTGDEAFDARVILHGREELLAARMSTAGRRKILAFVESGGSLEFAVLTLQSPPFESFASSLPWIAQLLLETAEALRIDDVLNALVLNAASDAVPQLRRRNLLSIHNHYRMSPECARAAELALADPAPEVILAGAQLLGREADARVIQILEDSEQRSAIRAQAIQQLAFGAGKAALPSLCTALRARDSRLREAAANSFSALASRAPEILQDATLRDALFRANTGSIDEPLGRALAAAFGRVDDPRSEAGLIEFLAHGSQEVQLLAARSLAQVGTVKSVEPLLEISRGGRAEKALTEGARNAVRAIQSRLGDVDAGRISLAKPDTREGAVKLAAEAGAVVLADARTKKPQTE